MKLIFGIYLDINRGGDFRKFIKSGHALKSLFKPKKDFEQSNCIISQIKISWKRTEVSIEVKRWFQSLHVCALKIYFKTMSQQ